MVNFYVLTTQRSGSTVLIRTLDEHPSVFCAGEIFFPGNNIHQSKWQYRFLGKKIIKSNFLLNIINISLLSFRITSHLQSFYQNAAENNEGAIGYKMMLGQYKFAPKTFKKSLSNKKCIILVRENLLKLAVSKIKAKTTKVYHLTDKTEISEQQKLYISPQNLEKTLEKLKRQNQEIEKLKGDNVLKVEYEELFDWNKLSHKIADFLEVEEIALSPVLKKINTKPMEEIIANYDALKIHFSTTEFSVFFK